MHIGRFYCCIDLYNFTCSRNFGAMRNLVICSSLCCLFICLTRHIINDPHTGRSQYSKSCDRRLKRWGNYCWMWRFWKRMNPYFNNILASISMGVSLPLIALTGLRWKRTLKLQQTYKLPARLSVLKITLQRGPNLSNVPCCSIRSP
mgnify:CR=1 FL=1